MSLTENFDARKRETANVFDIDTRFADRELRDAIDQIDTAVKSMAGHFLPGHDETVRQELDVADMRRLIVRLVWSTHMAAENYDAMFERVRQLATQVAEHGVCEK